MNKTDFLIDTINFYQADPKRRAVSDGLCKFRTKSGKNCAIGRYLHQDKLMEAIKFNPHVNSGNVGTIFSDWPELVKKDISRINVDFLEEVQTLHDNSNYWNKRGLNEAGNHEVKNICRKYKISFPKVKKACNL